MKGRDTRVIQCLKELCDETGSYLLLANMTKTASDPDGLLWSGRRNY